MAFIIPYQFPGERTYVCNWHAFSWFTICTYIAKKDKFHTVSIAWWMNIVEGYRNVAICAPFMLLWSNLSHNTTLHELYPMVTLTYTDFSSTHTHIHTHSVAAAATYRQGKGALWSCWSQSRSLLTWPATAAHWDRSQSPLQWSTERRLDGAVHLSFPIISTG